MHDVGNDIDVLIVGAGPAGMAAAAELSRSDLSALWIDQRERAGGAIHRQGSDGSSKVAFKPASVRRQWQQLSAAMDGMRLQLSGGWNFLGVDSDGLAIIEDRRNGMTKAIRARAIILALGAVERVLPRPGWQLPGVRTAGGMQVMLKETGKAPQGRILVAGNGPLTIALAAQLASSGNAPVAVIEAGNPAANPFSAAQLVSHPRLAREGASAVAALMRHRVSWLRGWHVVAIREAGASLDVEVASASGSRRTFTVEHVALHDGIRPNAFGLPSENSSPRIVHAGDCREALGAIAAEADGRNAAFQVRAALTGTTFSQDLKSIERERRAQDVLARLFAPVKKDTLACVPDETLLCRCEGSTVGDLRALVQGQPGISPREVKLNGRFAMGSCQGRFCADNVTALMSAMQGSAVSPNAFTLTGPRWPARPVSISSIIAGTDEAGNSVPE
jgi:thioredoxin reductase